MRFTTKARGSRRNPAPVFVAISLLSRASCLRGEKRLGFWGRENENDYENEWKDPMLAPLDRSNRWRGPTKVGPYRAAERRGRRGRAVIGDRRGRGSSAGPEITRPSGWKREP